MHETDWPITEAERRVRVVIEYPRDGYHTGRNALDFEAAVRLIGVGAAWDRDRDLLRCDACGTVVEGGEGALAFHQETHVRAPDDAYSEDLESAPSEGQEKERE